MNRLWLVLFLFIARNTSTSAQSNKNYFDLSIGLNGYQVKDKALNDLRHSGNLLSLGFDYNTSRETVSQKIQFDFVFNILGSRYESVKSTYIFYPEFNYSYNKRLQNGHSNLDIFVGGIVGSEYHMAFYENWDEAHLYWLTSYYLGIEGSLFYKKSKKLQVYVRPDFPIISFISRSPSQFMKSEISGSFKEIAKMLHGNLEPATLNHHFAFNIDLGLVIHHSKRLSQSFFWRIEYINNKIPYSKDIQIVSQTFGTSFRF